MKLSGISLSCRRNPICSFRKSANSEPKSSSASDKTGIPIVESKICTIAFSRLFPGFPSLCWCLICWRGGWNCFPYWCWFPQGLGKDVSSYGFASILRRIGLDTLKPPPVLPAHAPSKVSRKMIDLEWCIQGALRKYIWTGILWRMGWLSPSKCIQWFMLWFF